MEENWFYVCDLEILEFRTGFHIKSAPKVYALFEGNIGDFEAQNLPLTRIGSWEKGIIGFEEPLGLREIGRRRVYFNGSKIRLE